MVQCKFRACDYAKTQSCIFLNFGVQKMLKILILSEQNDLCENNNILTAKKNLIQINNLYFIK